MIVKKIKIQNFRNFKSLEIEPCDGVNIISGSNAQGKTNLIEAIWLLTGNRSFRGCKDNDLICFSDTCYQISAEFESEQREKALEILYAGRKTVRLNAVSKRSLSEILGQFCAVVFSPDHLELVKDGPDARRKFLDIGLVQIKPGYAHLLSCFNKILAQRNALLKNLYLSKGDPDTLEIWDLKLSEAAATVHALRGKYANYLGDLAQQHYKGISGDGETLCVCYQSTVWDEKSELDYREQYLTVLVNSRKADIQSGFTTKGPHRDDLELKLDQNDARSFGSQGQQRSIVLALKLAECDAIAAAAGEQPVLLLDDVLSELDEQRQSFILNHLEDRQVFITCCDNSAVLRLLEGKVFPIEKGCLCTQQEA